MAPDQRIVEIRQALAACTTASQTARHLRGEIRDLEALGIPEEHMENIRSEAAKHDQVAANYPALLAELTTLEGTPHEPSE